MRGLAAFVHDSPAKVKQNTTMIGWISSSDVVAGRARLIPRGYYGGRDHHPMQSGEPGAL